MTTGDESAPEGSGDEATSTEEGAKEVAAAAPESSGGSAPSAAEPSGGSDLEPKDSAAEPKEEAAEPSGGSEPAPQEEAPDAQPPAPPRAARPDEKHPWGIVARSLALGTLIAVSLLVWSQLAFGGKWVTPFISENKLEMPQRMRLIWGMVVSGGVGAIATAALSFVAHRRRWGIEKVERLLWFLSPLIVFPYLPQLFRWKPWKDHPEILLPLTLAIALMTEVLVAHALDAVPERVTNAWRKLADIVRAKGPAFLKKHGPLLVVLLATAGYVFFMSFYNIRWHHKLKTHNFDLAIDNNLIFSALKGAHMESTVTQGEHPGQYLATHAKLGQYVILPLYVLYPKPETLIVIQSALLGLGALPLYGFAKRFVSPWMSAAIALAYLLYRTAAFREFHRVEVSLAFRLLRAGDVLGRRIPALRAVRSRVRVRDAHARGRPDRARRRRAGPAPVRSPSDLRNGHRSGEPRLVLGAARADGSRRVLVVPRNVQGPVGAGTRGLLERPEDGHQQSALRFEQGDRKRQSLLSDAPLGPARIPPGAPLVPVGRFPPRDAPSPCS